MAITTSTVGQALSTVGQVLTYPVKWVCGTLPDQQLYKDLVARILPMPQSAPSPLSGGMTNLATFGTDGPANLRSGMDISQILFPGSQSALSTPAASAVYHAFGFATTLMVPVGIIGMIQDIKNWARKTILGDSAVNTLSLVQNLSLAGAGLTFTTTFRPLSIVDAIKDFAVSPASASLTGRVTYGALIVGLFFYTIFFAVLGVISGIRIFEGAKLKAKLNRAQTLEEKIQILQDKVKVDTKTVFNKLEKILNPKGDSPEAVRQFLIKGALTLEKETLRQMMKELNLPAVSEEKLEEMVRKTIQANVWGEVDAELEALGYGIVLRNAQAKKFDKITRVLNKDGDEAFKAILTKTNIFGRVSVGQVEGQELIDRVQAAANKKLIENSVIAALAVLGVAAMIAAIVFTGGTGLLIGAALMVAVNLIGMGVDGYYLYQSCQEETRTGPHDKKMLIASTALAIASLVLVLSLAASGVVTLGLFPLIAAIVLTALWLGQNGVTWAVMKRNERLHNEKNPTLEALIEALKNEESYKVIDKMLKKLEELDPVLKNEIDKQTIKHGYDRLKGAEEVARAIDLVKKAHFDEQKEAWRKALEPHPIIAAS